MISIWLFVGGAYLIGRLGEGFWWKCVLCVFLALVYFTLLLSVLRQVDQRAGMVFVCIQCVWGFLFQALGEHHRLSRERK